MRFFFKAKDGGPESNVTGFWLVESKRGGSIVLLRFAEGSREAFHTHAFNSISWVLKGALRELVKFRNGGDATIPYTPSFTPIITKRDRFHRVLGIGPATWVLSFRGPWAQNWKEYRMVEGKTVTLTHGRKEV